MTYKGNAHALHHPPHLRLPHVSAVIRAAAAVVVRRAAVAYWSMRTNKNMQMRRSRVRVLLLRQEEAILGGQRGRGEVRRESLGEDGRHDSRVAFVR